MLVLVLVLVLWCVGSRLWSVVGVCGETSSGVDVGVVLLWCLYGVGAVVWGWVEQWYVVWWEVETYQYQTSQTPLFLGGGKLLPKF